MFNFARDLRCSAYCVCCAIGVWSFENPGPVFSTLCRINCTATELLSVSEWLNRFSSSLYNLAFWNSCLRKCSRLAIVFANCEKKTKTKSQHEFPETTFQKTTRGKQHTNWHRLSATFTEATGLGNESISKHANKFQYEPYNNLLHCFQIFCGACGVSEMTTDARSSKSLRLSRLRTHFHNVPKTFLPGEI